MEKLIPDTSDYKLQIIYDSLSGRYYVKGFTRLDNKYSLDGAELVFTDYESLVAWLKSRMG